MDGVCAEVGFFWAGELSVGATPHPGLKQDENGQDQLKHEQSITRSLTLCAWQAYHAYVPRSRVTCRSVRRMGLDLLACFLSSG